MLLEIELRGKISKDGPISLSVLRRALAGQTFSRLSINLTSVGGDPAEAAECYSMIRALPVPVCCTAADDCSSAALLIFLGAGYRRCKENTTVLLHQVSEQRDTLPERVTADVLRHRLESLDATDRRMLDVISDRTGYSRDFFARDILTESPMSDVDMISTGLVHQIENLTPAPNPAWAAVADNWRKVSTVSFPKYMFSPSYIESARVAALFPELIAAGPRYSHSTCSN